MPYTVFRRLKEKWSNALSCKIKGRALDRHVTPISDQGFLVYQHTGEVIQAEKILKAAGIAVEVKGPPPDLQSGCDLVIVFPLMYEAAVLAALGNLKPLTIKPMAHGLLEPVSLFQITDYGCWLMVRAANLKITVEKVSQTIVNISGGGCPDVPYLAQALWGKTLAQAPEPLSLGQTLCCYSLQKALDEMRRQFS